MSFVLSTRLLGCACKAPGFPVLVNGIADPVDARVPSYCFVLRIHADDLVVHVRRVLVNPVGVENTQIGTPSPNSFLRSALKRPLVFQLVNTLVGRLAVRSAFGCRALTTSSSHSNTIYDIALLCFIAKSSSFVRSRRTRGPMDNTQLTVLPTADSQQEAHDVALLALSNFFQVFVGTHAAVLEFVDSGLK